MAQSISGNCVISGNCIITSSLLLDNISDAQYVFCHDRLYSAYAGNSVRIRRLSDDQEEEFGFSGNRTDWSGINTFAPGGFVITRQYNQGVQGGYVEQTTALLDPGLIYDSTIDAYASVFTLNGENLNILISDPTTIFTNDLYTISAFKINAFNGSPGNNDSYFSISNLSASQKMMNHYYSNYLGGKEDKYLVKASGSFGSDILVTYGTHAIGNYVVISHSRNGVNMYTKKNNVTIGSKVGTVGPLQFDLNSYLIYGGAVGSTQWQCSQNNYGLVCFNRDLTVLEDQIIQGYFNSRFR